MGLIDAIRDVTSEDTDVVVEQLLYEDTVQRHDAVESGVFVVATVDGDVVGWAHLALPQVETLRSTAQVTVGVRTEYHAQGVGTTLLDRALLGRGQRLPDGVQQRPDD